MNKNLSDCLSSREDFVFIIGHASALIRINSKLILFDPLWDPHNPYDSWKLIPANIDCSDILHQVDAIICSHEHKDHTVLPILTKAQKTVHIMGRRPQFKKLLRSAKLEVEEYVPGYWLPMVGLTEVEVYFVDHPTNKIDSACFLKSDKFCVYLGNDCFLDQAKINEIKCDIGKVDVALVPYASINFYPHLLRNLTDGEKENESKRLNDDNLYKAKLFIDEFRPMWTVPTGANLFLDQGASHPVNSNMTMPCAVEPNYLLAGEYILADTLPKMDTQILSLEEMIDVLLPNKATNYDFSYSLQEEDLPLIADKVKASKITVKDFRIQIQDMVIDLENLTVTLNKYCKDPYVKFHVDRKYIDRWITGKVSFQDLLGTWRFEYERHPNERRIDVERFWNEVL